VRQNRRGRRGRTAAEKAFIERFIEELQGIERGAHLGTHAIQLLSEAFAPRTLALYASEPGTTCLQLLAQAPITLICPKRLTQSLLQRLRGLAASMGNGVSGATAVLLSAVAAREEPGSLLQPWLDEETQSCLCLPLQNGSQPEGLLLAGFAAPAAEVRRHLGTLTNCGRYLALALSHARMQLALDQERLRLHELLDQMPEGVVIAEATSGVVRYANEVAAQILGRSPRELVGQPLLLSIPPVPSESAGELLFSWAFAMSRALSGTTLRRVETIVTRPDGTQVPVVCSSAPLHSAQQTLAGAVLILQDITHQKRLERDKNAFLALASHELRTPLAAILGYADLLHLLSARITAGNYDEQTLEVLPTAARTICSQAEQLALLVDELFTLSALDEACLTLHLVPRRPRELSAILQTTIEAQRATTRKHDLRLLEDEDVSTSDEELLMDEHRLSQVFTNLVNNAIKYSPEGGSIEIGIRLEGQPPTRVLVWVRDQGIGIKTEDQPHLFKRFYRASDLDDSLSGLGIGLYLAQQIVLRHDGRIWVESAPGQGATFFVALPLSPTGSAAS
jgi:PAS domain S-box-containing protein